MTSFVRNKETGILEVWRNGKKVGEIHTMGDDVNKKNEANIKDSAKK